MINQSLFYNNLLKKNSNEIEKDIFLPTNSRRNESINPSLYNFHKKNKRKADYNVKNEEYKELYDI